MFVLGSKKEKEKRRVLLLLVVHTQTWFEVSVSPSPFSEVKLALGFMPTFILLVCSCSWSCVSFLWDWWSCNAE